MIAYIIAHKDWSHEDAVKFAINTIAETPDESWSRRLPPDLSYHERYDAIEKWMKLGYFPRLIRIKEY